jgi:non-ribosomal peptide synthetase-like protein
MEDNTQLGHGSSLHENQTVPAGKHYHGAPAVETTTNYCSVQPKTCTTLRRVVYTALPLLEAFVLAPPVAAFVFHKTRDAVADETGKTLLWGMRDLILRFDLADVALASVGLLLVGIVVAVLAVWVLPRLLNLFIQEGRTYVLFGVHYWLAMLNRAVSNVGFLNLLFGDSSAIVYYLKWIGYDLSAKIFQSGSNFGVMQKHDNPLLCRIGSGTMVSDGLFMMNLRMSSTSFVTKRVTIGAQNYLGNGIHYPPDGKTGDNCLLATKVMVPIDGPVREDVGLLGSPCFEIPRVVDRDRDLSLSLDEPERQRRLKRKNLHNFVTVLGFLFFSWLGTFAGFTLLYHGVSLFASFGLPSLAATFILTFAFAFVYGLVLDRVAIVLSRLTPMTISLYDRQYWRTERYWKLTGFLSGMFGGTPVANFITRLSGIKIGRKIFDDGLCVTEKPLATIGDYCTFNRGCTLQSHSLEEGVFKCDHIRVGSGCTLGVAAFVHYGATLEDNVVLEQDCFLMKGETAAANSTWRGNPAMQV